MVVVSGDLKVVVSGRITCGGAHDAINVVAPDGREWKAISDGSLRNGAEFVTPILGWNDLETYQECIRAIRRAGAQTPPTRIAAATLTASVTF